MRDRLRNFVSSLRRRPFVWFVVSVVVRLGKANAGDLAAGLSYYAFLSLFPLLAGAIAVLGFFLPSATVQTRVLQFFERYLPGSPQIIERNIQGIVTVRGVLGIVGIAGLLWTGSVVFSGLERAINRTWGTPVRRPFYLRKLRDIGLAAAMGLTFYLSMGLSAFTAVFPSVDVSAAGPVAGVAGRVTSLLLIFATFVLVYEYMPNTVTRWRHVWPAAAVAALIFELARTAFALYLAHFARYEVIYGSLGALAALLVWLYVSAYTALVGAALAVEYSHRRG